MLTVSTSILEARAYHHGDLRSALLEAGLTALETQDIGEISLRQLARETGVSATAVYRHFPDKAALLSALAGAGIERLAAFQQAALTARPQDNAFATAGRAYVRWALANPGLFRVVFVHACPEANAVFGDSAAARMLQSYAAEVARDPAQAQQLVVQAWAVVHGLAMLMLDGQLPPDDALIDQVIDPRTLFGIQSGSSSEASP
jgi:AcrR family transcriptional regulator